MQSVVKEDLRREIRRLKQQYTPAQLEEQSESIIARLRPHLVDARVIMAYYSLPDEVNTHQLLDDLVAEGNLTTSPQAPSASLNPPVHLFTFPPFHLFLLPRKWSPSSLVSPSMLSAIVSVAVVAITIVSSAQWGLSPL